MSTLDDLDRQLDERLREQKAYRDKASELKSLYNELKVVKNSAENYKSSFDRFAEEEYVNFCGEVYNSEYCVEMKNIKTAYKNYIKDIDKNLDAINSKATWYYNKADSLNGIIGQIRALIRNAATWVENAFN